MSFKILLCGNAQVLINEFIGLNDPLFECFTAENDIEDIIGGIEVNEPDAFMAMFDRPDDDAVTNILTAKTNYSDIPFIIIGDSDFWEFFDDKAPYFPVLRIKRPVTAGMIASRLKKEYDIKPEDTSSDTSDPSGSSASSAASASNSSSNPSKKKTSSSSSSDSDLLDLSSGFSMEALKNSLNAVSAARKRILAVDDDKSILKMLKAALEKDYDVTTMASGKMAERFLETKTADLILLDYRMPDESGPEVLKKIRSNPKSRKIPVIFLTGVDEKEKVIDVIEWKIADYILKPINMERLRSSIKKALK